MERPTCESCPFWYEYIKSADHQGECRKHAPRLYVIDEGDYINDHALAMRHYWCGEHPDFPAYLASLKGRPPAVPGLTDLDIETA